MMKPHAMLYAVVAALAVSSTPGISQQASIIAMPPFTPTKTRFVASSYRRLSVSDSSPNEMNHELDILLFSILSRPAYQRRP
jgi:hypothetical protein